MLGKRCRNKIDFNSSEFSGFNHQFITFSGTLENASLFGAKRVTDSYLSSVSAKFAALTSLTRVDKQQLPSIPFEMVGSLELATQN